MIPGNPSYGFREGTAFIKIGYSLNRNGTGYETTTTNVSTISFTQNVSGFGGTIYGNLNVYASTNTNNLKLNCAPATGVGTDNVLVWNSTDKCVKQVSSVNCATTLQQQLIQLV